MILHHGRTTSFASPVALERYFAVIGSLVMSLTLAGHIHAALTFDVEYSTGVFGPPMSDDIVAGVSAATGTWSGLFRDDVTVTVKVELDSEALDIDLPTPATFAAALNSYEEHTYLTAAGALGLDAKTADDSAAVGLLQPGPYLEALTHDTSKTLADTMGGPSPEMRIGSLALGTTGPKAAAKWNSVLRVTRANSKALGLPVVDDGAYDIRLVLNDDSLPLFDFDRGDGIAMGKHDFQAIATHEIGHGMGFVSGVDHVDFAGIGGDPIHAAPGNPDDLSDEAIFSVLDLFRTSPETRPPLIPLGQPITGFVLDWRFGPPATVMKPKPFFSLDGAAIDPMMKTPFATGDFVGDGNQASHWAETMAVLGVMAADFGSGIIVDVKPIDITAFDVIGWDRVPEPASGLMLAVGLLISMLAQRPRRS